ncbi:hypothetical protein YC2023_048755 [Brassica napus]
MRMRRGSWIFVLMLQRIHFGVEKDAAVTGLVVLGQRWQQERWQLLQLMWQSSISSEKLSRVLEPLSRLKGVIVRGNPQASLVRSGTSSEI